jgi:hypothetical protein
MIAARNETKLQTLFRMCRTIDICTYHYDWMSVAPFWLAANEFFVGTLFPVGHTSRGSKCSGRSRRPHPLWLPPNRGIAGLYRIEVQPRFYSIPA